MTYRIAPAPRFAAFTAFDCHFCGHAELGKPVFLTDGTSTVAAGSGCASVALYGHKDRRTTARVRREADELEAAARRREEHDLEVRTAYAAALDDFRTDRNRETPNLNRARRTYWNGGGFDGRGITFPAFMETVAAEGLAALGR